MAGRLCDNAIMTVTELKRELEKLDPEEQKVLTAYLLHLRVTRHEEWLADMDRRLDKRDPQSWISLEELDRRLAQLP